MIGLYIPLFKELQKLGYQKVFVLSCDNPSINYKVIEYIISHCVEFECCIPRWKNNFLEPLFAIYPIEKAHEVSKQNLQEGVFKLTNLVSNDWKTNFISIEDEIWVIDQKKQYFININTREDLSNLKLEK